YFVYGELGHQLKHKHESLLLRFSLWEWMLFLGGTVAFAVLVTVLPAGTPRNPAPSTAVDR
ncbi:MAG TPA: hypothetical protein VGJ21_20910, partial [Terracidiphilus sp.]